MPEILSDRSWMWIAAVFYAVAFGWVTWTMLRGRARPKSVLLVLIAIGLVAQTIGLHQRGMEHHGCPLGNRLEIVQFIIWSFTILYLIVGPAFRLSLLGYFTSGLATVLSVISLAFGSWDGARNPLVPGGGAWIEIHASTALFAYGVFGTLALTSVMYLLQNFSLKQKRMRGVFSFLPSIVTLEGMSVRLLFTGLVVLTFSIGVGYVYFRREPDSITGAKLLVASGVWVAYFGVLLLRLLRRLGPNALAWTCVALFLAALLSLGPIHAGSHTGASPVHAASAAPARASR